MFETQSPVRDVEETDSRKIASSGTDAAQGVRASEIILEIARATVDLSQVAPTLLAMAQTLEENARRQAEQARATADCVQKMVGALEQNLGPLQASTAQIATLSDSIHEIAENTKLIAINAHIEAARAGEQGKVFAVIAHEIRELAARASSSTDEVHTSVEAINANVNQTIATIGLQKSGEGADVPARRLDSAQGMGWLREQMEEIAHITKDHSAGAEELNQASQTVRELCERLIHSVGKFRLEAHSRAAALVESLAGDARIAGLQRADAEEALRQALRVHGFLELAYITDARGIQITENVARGELHARYGDSALGRNWRERPWFRGAVEQRDVHVSPVYRSVATDEFCFTAAAAIRESGRVRGVIAVDVNLKRILG